jgi:hypothetical protein
MDRSRTTRVEGEELKDERVAREKEREREREERKIEEVVVVVGVERELLI